MTREITNLGRARMAAAGAVNLENWRAAQRKNSLDFSTEINRFRARLLADVGENRTAEQDALVLSCITTYAALYKVFCKLARGERVKRLETLLDRAARVQSALLRAIRALRTGASKPEASWEEEITDEIAKMEADRAKIPA